MGKYVSKTVELLQRVERSLEDFQPGTKILWGGRSGGKVAKSTWFAIG